MFYYLVRASYFETNSTVHIHHSYIRRMSWLLVFKMLVNLDIHTRCETVRNEGID